MKQSSVVGIIRIAATSILAAALTACAGAPGQTPGQRPDGRRPGAGAGIEAVHVAPPTGEQATDRASILAALDKVQPGGTIQFGPGTYLVGELIPIATPRIAMQGHPEGTTLRSCEPDEYDRMEQAVAHATKEDEAWAFVTRCGMFMLTGGHTAIRGFTFEYTRLGLLLGCCHRGGVMRPGDGGYRIEENTFRNVGNGIRAMLDAPVPSVIRDNRFINVFHALSAPQASHLHFIDNDVSVPEPHRVPATGYPSFAVAINALAEDGICEHNVVSGNRIEGHPIAIRVGTRPGSICRHNVIRDNTITASRVPLPATRIDDDEPLITNQADSTFFGVPLQLVNGSGEAGQGVLENNVIEGNRVIAAQGLAILLSHASRNRVANNTIVGVAVLDPFPGNILGRRPEWSEANGSAVWVSPGSDGNKIVGNTFEDITSHAVFIEGDSNHVELRSPSDLVRDLGSGNRVSGPAGAREPTADPPPSGILAAGRLVFHQLLHPVGEETYTLAREGDAYVLHADFSHNDRGQRTERSVALHLGLDLAPRASQLREIADGDTTETAVEVNGRLATVTDASGSRRVAVPDRFFTTTAFAPHAVQALLVRYWLRNGRPASIPVLPRGNAVVRHVGLDTLEVAGETVALDRYHVDGVRWGGQTLWLDGEERLVAAVSFDFNYQAVREGYEGALAFFSERARRDVLTRAEAASRRIPPLHTGTFALVGGALIDGTGAPPVADATVVVSDGRITGVGPRASVTIPADAEIVDVTGTTLLPGLWDMHAHLAGITDFGPIYLAAGVTTVRDVGNETDWGLALREAFATGRIAGPRLLLAAEIDGRVPEAVGAIQADTPEEARALVRHFHDLGFEQIKLYSRLRPELVSVIAGEAHRLGMTVTGHVPWGMSTIEALRAGMDQINHLSSVAAAGNMIPATIRESRDVAGALTWLADLDLDLETRFLMDTLVRHGTVVDPTLAALELRSRPANVPLHEIEPGAARMPPVMANTIERWVPGRPADFAELYDALQRKDVELVGILHRAGVPIVAGTDVMVPGHSLHRELELYVEAGMTPVEAIQAATIVPARAMGLDHDVGTVEVGKRADLIVVDGDPLRSIREIRNVRAVVANGRIFDTDALWRSVGFETWDQP